MKHLKLFQFYLGFLLTFGTPTYLLYDIRKITREEAIAFHAFMLIFVLVLGVIAIIFLSRLKGRKYLWLKPVWERPAAFVVLALSLPILLIVGLLVRLETPGPATYRQQRIGRNRRRGDRRKASSGRILLERRNGDRREKNLGGKPFVIYKMRSMVQNAEKETGAVWSTGELDPRVTRVGHIIRSTHLDELPQLFNVFIGQMSFVGPRPERAEIIQELDQVIDGYKDRLEAPPGITGLAQVRQKSDASLDDVKRKIQYDREYIQRSSLLFDISIAAQTLGLMFRLFQSLFHIQPAEKTAPKAVTAIISGNGDWEHS